MRFKGNDFDIRHISTWTIYDVIRMETLTDAQLTTDRVYLKLMGVYY